MQKVLRGNTPKYKQMFLMGDRIVGNTFNCLLAALCTFQISYNSHVPLIRRKKNGVECQGTTQNVLPIIVNQIKLQWQRMSTVQNKDPCSQVWSCDHNVGKNGRQELISLVQLPTIPGQSPCWMCQGLPAPPSATSGLGASQEPCTFCSSPLLHRFELWLLLSFIFQEFCSLWSTTNITFVRNYFCSSLNAVFKKNICYVSEFRE